MIPIYSREEADGLTPVLKNTSFAFLCPHIVIKDNVSKQIDIKSLNEKAVALSKSSNFGLYCLDSVLASVGWNANDDVFDPKYTWDAKASAVDKPVNYMHDEKDIIGHMTGSIVVGRDGKIVATNVEEIPPDFDIVVAAVLYTEWSDEKLQARMNNLISEIEAGKWFVSMECVFNDFDYAIITPDGQHKTVARTNETAFLTKHLRAYGGTGEYQGHKLGRLLKNFAFIGKGIVDNPANKKSVILNTESFVSKASLTSFPEIKADVMDEKIVQDLKSQVDSLVKSLAELKSDEVKKVSDDAAKTIADLQTELEAAKAKVTKLEADLVAKAEEVTKKTEELKTVATELVTVKRLAKAAAKGLKEEEAKALVTTWASATEEQFDSVLGLAKAEVKTENKPAPTADDVVDTTKTKAEASLTTPTPDADPSKLRAKASDWLSKTVLSKKESK